MSPHEIITDMLGSEGAETAQEVRDLLAHAQGAASIEGNAYIIDIDEAHQRVHVYHESIPHLDAEMSVAEFFVWSEEIVGN